MEYLGVFFCIVISTQLQLSALLIVLIRLTKDVKVKSTSPFVKKRKLLPETSELCHCIIEVAQQLYVCNTLLNHI